MDDRSRSASGPMYPTAKRRWFEATVTEAPEDMPCVSFDVTRYPHIVIPRLRLQVNFFGRVVTVSLLAALCRVVLLVVLWATLWAIFPHSLLYRGGVIFDAALAVLVPSLVGGFIASLLNVPSLACIMWGATIWNHVGPETGYLTGGIPPNLLQMAGLVTVSIVMSRSGFAARRAVLVAHWKTIICLGLLPFLLEATVHALVAVALIDEFDGRYLWGFMQGCLVSTLAPGVVVPGLLRLRVHGYEGPQDIMLIGIVVDAVFAVWATNFMASLVFSGDSLAGGALAWEILKGPLQFVVGALGGVATAWVIHCCALAFLAIHSPLPLPPAEFRSYVRLVRALVLAIGLMLVTLGTVAKVPGGAAVMVASMAATIGDRWMRPLPQAPKLEAHLKATRQDLLEFYEWLWECVVVPIVFAFTGADVVLPDMFTASYAPGGFGATLAGMAARFLSSTAIVKIAGLSVKHSVFVGLGWLAKGALQAALAAIGLNRGALADVPAALVVQRTAWLSTLICAPLTSIGVALLGPKLLDKPEVAADAALSPKTPFVTFAFSPHMSRLDMSRLGQSSDGGGPKQ